MSETSTSRTLNMANQYRPLVWEELIGQEPIKRYFKKSLSSGRIRSVYMLPGLHGCGKTTAAKILSRWLNCDDRQGHNPCNRCKSCLSALRGASPYIMEVDGTSQNNKDFVEGQLMAFLSATPMEGKYHVSVIDEFHRIKDPVRSMFLPFLEFMDVERPRSVAILCTTDIKSLDGAMQSRMSVPGVFQGLSPQEVAGHYAEKLGIDPEVCKLILKVSGGSMRQFWSTYDSLQDACDAITIDSVLEWAGGLTSQERDKLWGAVKRRDKKAVKDHWDYWMTSNKAGFEFVVTQLLEDLDRMVVDNPDDDRFVEAHMQLAATLTFMTHPQAKLEQLILGQLYAMSLPLEPRKSPPRRETCKHDLLPIDCQDCYPSPTPKAEVYRGAEKLGEVPLEPVKPPKPLANLGDFDESTLPPPTDPWAEGHPESALAAPEPKPEPKPEPAPAPAVKPSWADL